MKKIILIAAVLFASHVEASAQKVYTKNGNISFFSTAPLENITADNNQVMSVLDTQTGELLFSVLIKGFHFKKSLMEEHFNENYLESNKFPKASFKGNISEQNKIDYSKNGTHTVNVTGDLTIHGVTQKVSATGTISIKSGAVSAVSKFKVKLADYKISIPGVVKDQIAETIDINVSCGFDQKM